MNIDLITMIGDNIMIDNDSINKNSEYILFPKKEHKAIQGFEKVAVGYFGRLAGKRSLADILFMKKQNLWQRILNKRKLSPLKILSEAIPVASVIPAKITYEKAKINVEKNLFDINEYFSQSKNDVENYFQKRKREFEDLKDRANIDYLNNYINISNDTSDNFMKVLRESDVDKRKGALDSLKDFSDYRKKKLDNFNKLQERMFNKKIDQLISSKKIEIEHYDPTKINNFLEKIKNYFPGGVGFVDKRKSDIDNKKNNIIQLMEFVR